MHLIIANSVAEQLAISDRTSFLLGGVAPDAVSSKDSSHFYAGDHSDFSRYIDAEGFLTKYANYKQAPYILGYYSHLIADDLWLKGFYIPWLKNRLENDNSILELYHNDFRLLNGKLLDYYGVKDELKEAVQEKSEVIELEEVKLENIKEFIPYVLEDMVYDKSSLNQPLNGFTFNQIVGYIETSVHKSVMQIKTLKEITNLIG